MEEVPNRDRRRRKPAPSGPPISTGTEIRTYWGPAGRPIRSCGTRTQETPSSGKWVKHAIEATHAPIHGEPADMDGDGDLDVVMALGAWGSMHLGDQVKPDRDNRPVFTHSYNHHIVWYENDGVHENGWTRHLISDDLNEAFEAVAGDLDGDGDTDVVASGFSRPGRVLWYENSGDPSGPWTAHMVKDNWTNANQVLLADLDGDSDLDISSLRRERLA